MNRKLHLGIIGYRHPYAVHMVQPVVGMAYI